MIFYIKGGNDNSKYNTVSSSIREKPRARSINQRLQAELLNIKWRQACQRDQLSFDLHHGQL